MVLLAVEAFREEGRQQVAAIATNLWYKGMGPEEVVEVTKLSREQVESLWQEISETLEL